MVIIEDIPKQPVDQATDEQCTTLKGTNLCGHFLVA